MIYKSLVQYLPSCHAIKTEKVQPGSIKLNCTDRHNKRIKQNNKKGIGWCPWKIKKRLTNELNARRQRRTVLMEMTQLLYYGTLGFIIRIAWVSIVSCQRVVESVCVCVHVQVLSFELSPRAAGVDNWMDPLIEWDSIEVIISQYVRACNVHLLNCCRLLLPI